jgi:DNA-binding response OmpR family regulator
MSVERVIFGLKERILAIDDDISFLTQTRRWLQKSGYDVVTAESGASGLRRFFTDRPDLVLLNQPVRNRWLRSAGIREMSDTPIIMLTEQSKSGHTEGIHLGADDLSTAQIS